MPATSPAALARRRERAAEWRAQRRADPAYRERENVKRRSGKARPPARPKFRRVYDAPFVGCDGEATTDPQTGEHRYCLFRMGERELFKGGRRLDTPELLQFIVEHPRPRDYLVGFFFDYDINCILRGIQRVRDPAKPDTPSRLERLLAIDIAEWEGTPEPSRAGYWTWLNFDGFPEFGVKLIAKNFIRVCHSMMGWQKLKGGRRRWAKIADPATVRTIEDVGANFQSSFVVALQRWGIGDKATLAAIEAGKAGRASFATISDEIRRYNALECSLLGELMEAFRSATLAAGITPRTWNGAGKLGAAMLDANGMMKRKEYEDRFPLGLRTMARQSFYGGRFETTRAGMVEQKVFALDKRSAFPAAMPKIPCLRHGRFVRASASRLAQAPRSALFVCPVRFTHPRDQFLCGFPIRSRKGPISWPREGSGVYWSPEIRSAKRLGAKVELLGGWLYQKCCSCPPPFAWIERGYAERRKLDAIAPTRGVPIKLGINSVYGKQVQRVGARTWANHVHGALITAHTRAEINDAIRTAGPRNVVMIAADCLFTVKRRPKVEIGKELGQWGVETHPGLFIVQPGLYWPLLPDRDKLKTRGVPAKFFKGETWRFEAAWADYLSHMQLGSLFGEAIPPPIHPPALGLKINVFISLRVAYRLGKPERGATWLWLPRKISFGWATKRRLEKIEGSAAILGPLPGDRDWSSVTYDEQGKRLFTTTMTDDGQLKGVGEMMASEQRAFIEAMPDPLDMGPPHSE
jgi:hypothetical protein